MRFHLRAAAIGLVVLLGAAACDSSTASLPILIITNTWGVEGDPDRKFSFQSADDEETYGTFEGFERLDTPGGLIENELLGAWAAGRLEFTVNGTRNGARFEGTFDDDPDRLTVHSDDLDETLVLVRGL